MTELPMLGKDGASCHGKLHLFCLDANALKLKSQIEAILDTVSRPGMDKVKAFLAKSRYYMIGCVSHHVGRHGLAVHCLDVYKRMGHETDSAKIVAFFHDLGKTVQKFSKDHGKISVQVLEKLGFQLEENEKTAIANHHCCSMDFLTSSLRRSLTLADMMSARAWHKKKD